MTIVDTNVILRWFLGDIPDQAASSARLLEDSGAGELYVDRVTLAEITYVLRTKGYNHKQVYQILEGLYAFPSIREAEALDWCAVGIFGSTTLDFEDCVMAANHQVAGYEVTSFDKDLQKYLVGR